MGQSIKKNYILNCTKTISGMLFPLISFAYVSRILSVEGIGKVDYVTQVVSFFILFASLGVFTYGTREAAKVRDNQRGLSKLVREIIIFNVITTLLSYTVFLILVFYFDKFIPYQNLFLIYGVYIVSQSICLNWLFNALENYEYITFRYLLFQVLSLILIFLFVREKDDYLIYIGILAFAGCGSDLLNFFYSRKFVNLRYHGPVDVTHHVRPVLLLFFNTLLGYIYASTGSIMLGLLSSPYDVGLYAASNKMVRVCLGLITALMVVVLPRASFYMKNKDTVQLNALVRKSINFILFSSIPLVCFVMILGEDMLCVLGGQDFTSATHCAQILSALIFLVPMSMLATHEIIIPSGMDRKLLLCSACGAVVNIALNLILIPYCQEKGAAIAAVSAELTYAVLAVYFASKCVNFMDVGKGIWHYLLAALVMTLILIPFYNFSSGITRCIFMGALGMLSYIGVLLVLKDEMVLMLMREIQKICRRVFLL